MILEQYKNLSLLWGKVGVTTGTACPTAGPCPVAVLHWSCRRWHKDHHGSLHWETSRRARSIIFRVRAASVEVQSLWPPLCCCPESFSSLHRCREMLDVVCGRGTIR